MGSTILAKTMISVLFGLVGMLNKILSGGCPHHYDEDNSEK